jgi:proton-dependent oligopeptide transporter, POT family
VIFFRENIGVDPHYASLVVGFFTCGITLSQLFLGGVTDKIGVRKSLWLSLLLLTIGKVGLTVGGHFFSGGGIWSGFFILTIVSLFVVAIAFGVYQPAAYAGVKQFTDKKSAAMGYAMLYGLFNLGAFFIGFASPHLREAFEGSLPPNGLTAVFWACTAAVALGLVVVSLMMTKKSVKLATEMIKQQPAEPQEEKKSDQAIVSEPEVTLWDAQFTLLFVISIFGTVVLLDYIVDEPLENFLYFLQTGNPAFDLPIRIGVFLAFLAPALILFLKRRPDHAFRNSRFVFFIFILIPVQTLFAHNWLTLPSYIKYSFSGFVSENYELISNINPLLIFLFAPLVAALTAKANVYRMMIWGTFIMAAPTFLLAIGPHTSLLYAYIFLMTIGEAMWQPRFLQYIAEIAPEGKTGIYMGIGQFPWFLTKMIAGFYAGWFLARYCPETGQQDTETMWLIYALIAIVSPVVLFLVRKWGSSGTGMGSPET